MSQGLCDGVRVEEIAATFDLEVPASWDQSELYFDRTRYTDVSCRFAGDGDRFATHLERFTPDGLVVMVVFEELDEAERRFRDGTVAGDEPELQGLTARVATGWWDVGERREYVRDQGPRGEVDIPIFAIDVSYVVRHANLFIEARLGAIAYPEDVEGVTDVLDGLVRALLDEAASHLTLRE